MSPSVTVKRYPAESGMTYPDVVVVVVVVVVVAFGKCAALAKNTSIALSSAASVGSEETKAERLVSTSCGPS